MTQNGFLGSNISFIINDWQHLMYPIGNVGPSSRQCFFSAKCTKGHFLAADPQSLCCEKILELFFNTTSINNAPSWNYNRWTCPLLETIVKSEIHLDGGEREAFKVKKKILHLNSPFWNLKLQFAPLM